MPQLVESKNNRNKKRRKLVKLYNVLRSDCATKESSLCKDIIEPENEMCIAKCMSEICYDNIYGSDRGGELEPGEVDENREAEFENCVKNTLKTDMATKQII